MLVDADGARAGVGAGVELGDAADGDAGLRDGVLGEGPHLLEHPLGGADALADEDLVGALLAAARRLEALLLVAAALDADELARHQRRDRRAQQGPPRVHHRLASLEMNRLLAQTSSGGGEEGNRWREARVLGEDDEVAPLPFPNCLSSRLSVSVSRRASLPPPSLSKGVMMRSGGEV